LEELKHRNALPVGFWLNEYQIESILGKSGGFGITYLAMDTNLGQRVAIKEYLPSDFAVREGMSTVYARSTVDEEAFEWGLKRFIEESRNLAQFNHPNIVRVLRFFKANGTAYMVMEYQPGKSFDEYLKTNTFSESDLISIILPLTDALSTIHAAGMLHRDIKPTNLYIRSNHTPVLLDFGSARYAIGQKSVGLTSVVTPGYAPLEQYDNEIEDQGPWTDIYALGAVLYFAITGEIPPAATRRIMSDPMIAAIEIGYGKYSQHLLEAIDWALMPNKEERPQTIVDWREKILLGIPQSHSPSIRLNTGITSTIRQTTKFVSKPKTPPWLMTMAGMLAFIICAIAVGVLFDQNRQLTEEQEKRIVAETKIAKIEANLTFEMQQHKKVVAQLAEVQKTLDEVQGFYTDPMMNADSVKVAQCEQCLLQQKFYDVVGVTANDMLNVRQYPSTSSDVITKIPPDSRCVAYLNRLYIIGTNIWIYIEYNSVQGWVNSIYLRENKECPLK